MSTAYSMSDTLPKDQGGQKLLGWQNTITSANDFSLTLGLGASTIGATSRIHSYLGVATHISASPITNAPAGVMRILAYTLNPSSIATNNAIHQRGSDRGEAYITGLSGTTCVVAAASRETLTVASGVLYNVFVAGVGMGDSGSLVVMNGTTSLANFIFDKANQTLPMLDFGIHGACFGSLILERRNAAGGTPFVSMNYTIWGQ